MICLLDSLNCPESDQLRASYALEGLQVYQEPFTIITGVSLFLKNVLYFLTCQNFTKKKKMRYDSPIAINFYQDNC